MIANSFHVILEHCLTKPLESSESLMETFYILLILGWILKKQTDEMQMITVSWKWFLYGKEDKPKFYGFIILYRSLYQFGI